MVQGQDYAECTSDDDGSDSGGDNDHWGYFMEGEKGPRDNGYGETAGVDVATVSDGGVSVAMAVERAAEAHELVRSRYASGQSTEVEFHQAIAAHNLAVELYESEDELSRRSARDDGDQRYGYDDVFDSYDDGSYGVGGDEFARLDTRSFGERSDAAGLSDDNEPIPLEMVAQEQGPVRAGAIHAYAFHHDVAPAAVTVAMVEASPKGVPFWVSTHDSDSCGDSADPEYLEFLADTKADPTRRRRSPRPVSTNPEP
jgi:hypothetical protein